MTGISEDEQRSPKDPVSLRECRSSDLYSVLEFWKRSGATPGSTDTLEALETRLERDRDLFLLAVDNSRVVGSVIGGWDGWRGNIYRLVVDPDFRRRGLATSLVQEVERRLQARGAVRVYALAVREEYEPAAIAFWKSGGYELNPRLAPYVKSIGEE